MVTLEREHEIRVTETLADQSTPALQMGSWCDLVRRFLTGALAGDNGLGLHTVVASCNGTTASAADNMTAGASAWVSAVAGTAHSWIVYESVETGVQTLIDLGVGGTEQVRFVWARPDSPFSLASLSTLNAPANPTGAIEQSTVTYRQVFENTPTPANHLVAMWRDAEGSFVIATAQAGSGYHAHAFTHLVLETAGAAIDGSEDADVALYPYFQNCARLASTSGGAFTRGVLDNGSNYLSGNMWWSDGSTVTGVIDQRNVLSLAGSGGTISGRLPRQRLEVYNNISGRVAYRGHVPDLGIIAGSPTTNDLEPGGDAVRRIVLGVWDMLTLGATAIPQ